VGDKYRIERRYFPSEHETLAVKFDPTRKSAPIFAVWQFPGRPAPAMDSPVWCKSQYVSADGGCQADGVFYLCKDSSLVWPEWDCSSYWEDLKKERESCGKKA